VGIFRGKRVAHVAPPAKHVSKLVAALLAFVKNDETPPLIKSAVVHFELEFIHPFSDGNGRIGRFWQHVLLARTHPIFEHVPFESVIHERQAEYYRVLRGCDRIGDSTAFIEFSLSAIVDSLRTFLTELRPAPMDSRARIDLAAEIFGTQTFSRKAYLAHFKTLSTASASRDLRLGVEQKRLRRSGDKAKATYRFTTRGH
jgi:Fic family protein